MMLIEGLGSATVVNGMMRIDTLYRNAKGDDVSSGELLIPLGRVEAIVDGLKMLLQRAQEAATQPSNPSEAN